MRRWKVISASFPYLVGLAALAYAITWKVASRREETPQAMLDKLRKHDGSTTSSVALLTDIPAEDIERLGGISEDT